MSGHRCHLCGIEILDEDGQDLTGSPARVVVQVERGMDAGDDLPNVSIETHAHDECAVKLVRALVYEAGSGGRPLIDPEPQAF